MLLRYEENFLRALQGLHTFSGCDSTIIFCGNGRRKLLNIVKDNEEYSNAVDLIGESFQIEDLLFDIIESMVCQANRFLNKSNVNDVDMKNEKFCWKKFPEPSKFPPTEDMLHQHIKHVNYPIFIQKNAVEANQEIPEANQHGCDVIDLTYKVHWMDNQTSSKLNFIK